MKQNSFFLWTIVILSIALGFFVGSNQRLVHNVLRSPLTGSQKINQFISYLDEYYVDAIDTDSLASEIIQEMVQRLDPHSFYIPKDQLARLTENMQGNFVGIGVSFFMIQDSLKIIRVLKGGPSEKANILAGDRILIANQDTLYGKTLSSEEVVERLRGENESEVEIEVYRPLTDKKFNVLLKRGEVPITSVNHYLIDPQTGYVKISRFAETTNNEFQTAVAELKSQGAVNLILDLRDNPGGYIHIAEQVADTFLSKGQQIVMVESNQGEKKVTFASENGQFEKGLVYILINGESASASEVVAGALQDNDRAWLVGQRSFGKGLVQQQMPLGSQEAIRLTTARYYTPTGRSIQRPFDQGNQAYFDEIGKRRETGEIADVQKIPQNDSLAFTTPKGRTVYGGGGIVPDIYVPSEETLDEQWSNYLLRSNLINHFVFTQLDRRRNDFLNLDRTIFVTQPLAEKEQWLKALEEYLKAQAVPVTITNKELAYSAIHAYLGLQLFDEATRLAIIHKQDPFIRAALFALQNSPKG